MTADLPLPIRMPDFDGFMLCASGIRFSLQKIEAFPCAVAGISSYFHFGEKSTPKPLLPGGEAAAGAKKQRPGHVPGALELPGITVTV